MSIRFCLAILTLVFFSSCTKKTNQLDPDTFVFRIQSEPPNIDPAKGVDQVSIDLMNNLGEGLVQFDNEMRVIPALAETYEISKDGMTYTFKIRKDVQWTDGVPLKAQNFVDSWKRILDPHTAGEYAYFFYDIKGAEEYNSGKTKSFEQVAIKALDDLTLEVKLKRPASYWINLPAFVVMFPVRVDVAEKFGDRFMEPEHFVGLGPYKLTEWQHDNRLVLERNENYYGKKPKIKKAIALIVEESTTAVGLFEQGMLDFMRKLPTLQVDQYKDDPRFHFQSYFRNYYYAFNQKKKPFDNVKVRKALAYAIDRDELVRILRGGRDPIRSWIPKGMLGYSEDIGVGFDTNMAKKLLAEAGYPEGKNFPKVVASFDVREDNKVVAEAIQGMWKRHLGISVELSSMEWKVYLEQMRSDASQIFRLGWGADFPDPDNFMNLFLSTSGNNHTRWANNEYDSLIQKASAEQAPSMRAKLYNQAQKILLEEDVVIIPLFLESLDYLLSPRVKNFNLDQMNNMFIKNFNLNN